MAMEMRRVSTQPACPDRSADQAPAIHTGRELLGRGLVGGGSGFVAIGLGEFQPVGRQRRRLRHGRRRNFGLFGLLRRQFGLLGRGRNQRFARRIGARQQERLQDVEFLILLELQETRRGNYRLGMDVERRVGGADSLRGQFGGLDGQFAQGVHVRGGEQLTLVGPSFDAARGADA